MNIQNIWKSEKEGVNLNNQLITKYIKPASHRFLLIPNMNSKALWFTGLSGSGKSTLAEAVKKKFANSGQPFKILDGDEIRKGLNNDLSYSIKDRYENIRRVAEVNNLFLDHGISTINAFISPTVEIRSMAKSIIGENRFIEICLTTPIDVCIKRDPKGFYKKIKDGQVKNFTGIDSIFEPSTTARLYLDTSQFSLAQCVEMVLKVYKGEKKL